jgi:hypothetical protein
MDGDSSQSPGLYVHDPVWSQRDSPGMLQDWGFAATALSSTEWLCRYRFQT